MDDSADKILFEMKCKYGIFREYRIPYMDYVTIRCARVSELLPSPTLKAPAKLLAEMCKHFSNYTREITTWIYSDHMRFKTFIESDDQNYFDLPCTSFSWDAADFTVYNHTVDMSSTFNLRNVRAFLDFAQYQNPLVSVYFQPDAKPIEFLFNNSADHYSSRVIMATIEFSEPPSPPTYIQGRAISDRSRSQSQSTSANESLSYPTSSDITSENSQPGSDVLNRSSQAAAVVPSFPLSSSQQSREDSRFRSRDSNAANEEVVVPSGHSRPSQSQAEVQHVEAGDSVHGNEVEKIPTTRVKDPLSQDDFSSVDHDHVLTKEIDNIAGILDSLPNYSQSSTYSDEISLMGSALQRYHHQFIHGDNDFDDMNDGLEVIVPESDED